MDGETQLPDRIIWGMAAGLVGTALMTSVQLMGTKQAPAKPPEVGRPAGPDEWTPEHVTDEVLEKVHLDPEEGMEEIAASVLAHFAFGIAWGGIYGAWRGDRGANTPRDIGFGLFVWALHYGALFPASRITRPLSQEDPRRITRLFLAHVVYGAVVGKAYDHLKDRR